MMFWLLRLAEKTAGVESLWEASASIAGRVMYSTRIERLAQGKSDIFRAPGRICGIDATVVPQKRVRMAGVRDILAAIAP